MNTIKLNKTNIFKVSNNKITLVRELRLIMLKIKSQFLNKISLKRYIIIIVIIDGDKNKIVEVNFFIFLNLLFINETSNLTEYIIRKYPKIKSAKHIKTNKNEFKGETSMYIFPLVNIGIVRAGINV